MKRNLLAAAAAAAPLLAAAVPALAQVTPVTISSSTSTPVKTSTAGANNTPADVTVSGSIGLTTAGTAGAPITALTLDSSNNINITGSVGSTGLNYTNGVNILTSPNGAPGITGSAINQGTIEIIENYTPPLDPNNNGLYTGLFAQGQNRIGLEVTGSGVFTGNNQSVTTSSGAITVNGITNIGTISVDGNNSEGVLITAPIVGDFMSIACVGCTTTNAATTPTTAPVVIPGTIQVTGQQAVGFQVNQSTPTGNMISGNVRLANISATGPGAQAVVLNGNVGGYLDISGTVTSTGYRSTTRQTNPIIAATYSAMEMQQGGAAVTIGGTVSSGVIISTTPANAGTGTAYTANTYFNTNGQNIDGNLIPDILQGAGAVESFGQAPAVQIGSSAGTAMTIGAYTSSSYVSIYNGNTGFAKNAQFGFVNQGSILGESLYDQYLTPYLLAPVSATALQIGGQILINPTIQSFNNSYQPVPSTTANLLQNYVAASYGTSGAVNIVGGVYNSGTIAAYSYQANSTAIHIGAGANLEAGASSPSLYNDGTVYASSIQENSATTVTVYPGYGANKPITETVVPVAVTAILIDKGASVASITNNSGILAELTGSGGVGGTTAAIVDNSGTLATVSNTGSITALMNQTDISTLMPVVTATIACQTCAPTATSVAIDMQYGTTPQVINQSSVVLALPTGATVTQYLSTSAYTTLNTVVSYLGNYYVNVAEAGAGYDPIDYPQYWREIGAVSPSITGDIYMGSASDTLNIQAGTVNAVNIWMGGATNTINVGVAPVGTSTGSSAVVAGSITETAGGAFTFNVNNGTLADYNPKLNQAAQSIYVGANGVLTIAVDPVNNQNTQFHILGSANIAPNGQIGLAMVSLQVAPVQTYTVMYGAPGTISAASLGATAIGNTPFLYSATASYVASASASTAPGAPAGDSAVDLTVTRKTAQQLGFNAAETAAFEPVLATLAQSTPANAGIQQALLVQNTQAGLKSVYDQLLPNQGQGIFQALDAAVEKVSSMTQTRPDNATTQAGQSLWLQEVNEYVDRSGTDSLGSTAQILGLVGGYERMGAGGGAIGVTLGYYNDSENTSAAQLGAKDLASLVEASVYYRRQSGPLTVGARIGGGYGWFSETRVFAAGSTIQQANGNWTGGFIEAHLGASYEVKLFGPYYARPEVSIDYLRLAQGGYQENGADPAFNLKVASSTDTQASVQGLMVFGRQWGKTSWFRSEIRMGYREVIDGTVGDTTASFAGGNVFTMLGDPDKGGWATVGFSLKSGSEFSYLALEGDADLRKGQQRYDLRVAGRSVF